MTTTHDKLAAKLESLTIGAEGLRERGLHACAGLLDEYAALLRSQQPACTGGERVIWTQDGLSAEAIIIRAHQHDDSLRLIQTAGGEHWARVKDLRSQQPGQDEREAFERLASYVKRRRLAKGISVEQIHGFDVGSPSEAVLLVSDIEAVIAARLSAPQAAGRQGIKVKRALFSFHSEQDWVNKAKSRYANCGVQKGFYITVDAAGHVMHRGLCFEKATYPVTCYELQTNWYEKPTPPTPSGEGG